MAFSTGSSSDAVSATATSSSRRSRAPSTISSAAAKLADCPFPNELRRAIRARVRSRCEICTGYAVWRSKATRGDRAGGQHESGRGQELERERHHRESNHEDPIALGWMSSVSAAGPVYIIPPIVLRRYRDQVRSLVERGVIAEYNPPSTSPTPADIFVPTSTTSDTISTSSPTSPPTPLDLTHRPDNALLLCHLHATFFRSGTAPIAMFLFPTEMTEMRKAQMEMRLERSNEGGDGKDNNVEESFRRSGIDTHRFTCIIGSCLPSANDPAPAPSPSSSLAQADPRHRPSLHRRAYPPAPLVFQLDLPISPALAIVRFNRSYETCPDRTFGIRELPPMFDAKTRMALVQASNAGLFFRVEWASRKRVIELGKEEDDVDVGVVSPGSASDQGGSSVDGGGVDSDEALPPRARQSSGAADPPRKNTVNPPAPGTDDHARPQPTTRAKPSGGTLRRTRIALREGLQGAVAAWRRELP